MRIKIIGDNNCARATRLLLRKGGLAVTEFLPAEVVMQAPHHGYVITIDLAPAPHPLGRTLEVNPDPTHKPGQPTHGQSTSGIEETSAIPEASADKPAVALAKADVSSPTSHVVHANIHFDSVDSELEAAILRHVTQLAAAPVVVDRPGGVVHSERELRIVVPNTGDAKADDAAAVAVEFGVLRGFLDLASSPSRTPTAGKSSATPSGSRSGGGKKWWSFVVVLVVSGVLGLAGNLAASPRHGLPTSTLSLTALDNILLAGCPACVRTSLSYVWTSPSFVRTSKYNSYSLAVLHESNTALTGNHAGALRSTTDRLLHVNPGKPGGAAVSGADVIDGGGGAFRVNCVVGCSGFQDANFTPGSTSEINISGKLNDGLAPVSSNNAAASIGITCCGAYVSPKPIHIVSALSARVRSGGRVHLLPAAAFPAQGQFSTGQAPVKITDGTNTLVVDPCKGQIKFYVSINQTANAQLVTGTASKKIYICSIHVVVAIATSVALVEGTGSVCATGTAGVSGFGGATAATGWNFAVNGGIVLGNGDAAVGAEGTNADNLCLFNSGSGQVSGGISYVVQ